MTRDRVLLNVATEHGDRSSAAVLPGTPARAGCLPARCACAETIGDVDILATAVASDARADRDAWPRYSEAVGDESSCPGPTKTSIRCGGGAVLQVDLRVVRAGLLWRGPAVLHRLAGAQRRGPPDRGRAGSSSCRSTGCSARRGRADRQRHRGRRLRRLGLDWVPPPMREDSGEVTRLQGRAARARSGTDLRGDLHTHTNLTDGVASLEDMVAAAKARGTSTTRSPTTRRTWSCSG